MNRSEMDRPEMDRSEMTGRSRNPLRWRWLWHLLAGLLALFVTWVACGYFLVVSPRTDKPRPADAVVVLGPATVGGRFALGQRLIADGYADNLVVSTSVINPPIVTNFCQRAVTDTHIVCFVPDPTTTQGEAEEMKRLTRERGWKSIIVVTSTYHVTRAKFIMSHCFHGKILMVAPERPHFTFADWAYQYAYQCGGWAKALWHRGC